MMRCAIGLRKLEHLLLELAVSCTNKRDSIWNGSTEILIDFFRNNVSGLMNRLTIREEKNFDKHLIRN